MKYKIRIAKQQDALELEKLMKESYAIYTELLDGILLPPMNADYNDEIANYPTWVLEYNDHLIGGLIMYFDDNEASLSNVAVSPRYKGQGFGTILINFAESIAVERGYNHLSLVTHIKLIDNIRYYKKNGYEEKGRDSNKVYFRKTLNK